MTADQNTDEMVEVAHLLKLQKKLKKLLKKELMWRLIILTSGGVESSSKKKRKKRKDRWKRILKIHDQLQPNFHLDELYKTSYLDLSCITSIYAYVM